MKRKKISFGGVIVGVFKVFWVIGYSILKAVFVDIFKNIKQGLTYSFNPEEKDKIKGELEMKKKIEFIDTRLKRVERLIYSVFKDPEYAKRDKGKMDVEELKKEVK